MRRTKIVCTIGPASSSEKDLDGLVAAGMDIARLNCSHGTTDERLAVIRRIRGVAERRGRTVSIFLDLRGPRLRMGEMPEGGREAKTGEEVLLVTEGTDRDVPESGAFQVQSPFLATGVRAGQKVFINDGNIELSVLDTDGEVIRCKVVRGGLITSHKGINAPGAPLAVPILEAEDLDDLRVTIQEGIDAVAVSFVRTVEDLNQVRAAVNEFRPGLPLIAKIETRQAMDYLQGILAASEGIMVARGDLGVEVSPEEVPVLQKRLIAAANSHGKPVITATQMLESMVVHERPTRAEASDVANAVFDGTDALMLSAETTVGKHPVTVVETMARIVVAAEKEVLSLERASRDSHAATGVTKAICEAACHAADQLQARAIAAFTQSGATASFLSRYRPKTPMIAFTCDPAVCRRLNFYWGVRPAVMPYAENTDALIPAMESLLLREGLAGPGDTVVIVAGIPLRDRPRANFMKVHVVGGGEG